MSNWVSIKDQLPPAMDEQDGISRLVLVYYDYDGSQGWCVAFYDHAWEEWRTEDFDGLFIAVPDGIVTHWMPLPEPPEAQA